MKKKDLTPNFSKKKDKINWTVRKLEIEPLPHLVRIAPKTRVPSTWTEGQRQRFLGGYER